MPVPLSRALPGNSRHVIHAEAKPTLPGTENTTTPHRTSDFLNIMLISYPWFELLDCGQERIYYPLQGTRTVKAPGKIKFKFLNPEVKTWV